MNLQRHDRKPARTGSGTSGESLHRLASSRLGIRGWSRAHQSGRWSYELGGRQDRLRPEEGSGRYRNDPLLPEYHLQRSQVGADVSGRQQLHGEHGLSGAWRPGLHDPVRIPEAAPPSPERAVSGTQASSGPGAPLSAERSSLGRTGAHVVRRGRTTREGFATRRR